MEHQLHAKRHSSLSIRYHIHPSQPPSQEDITIPFYEEAPRAQRENHLPKATSPVLPRLGFKPWSWPSVLKIFYHGITWTLGRSEWQYSNKAAIDQDPEERGGGREWHGDCPSKRDQPGAMKRREEQPVDQSPLETAHVLELTAQLWLPTMMVALSGKMPILLKIQGSLLQQLGSLHGLPALHPGQSKLS